ncbi:FT-interacting protein 3 [Medicago truncatula]|uniref:Anthranilate phosphoribosyltransferase-like protein n=2 Tax=Medicago truncatula TaxID=3880 RepID=G7I924_MEDTR|nr:FT-interacting protein 3 [Medicago truncatula]AES59194.2 anthranilate phosphoribosyltransferase-like protein [Medicago truncatula]
MANNENAPKETSVNNNAAFEADKLTRRYDLVEEMEFLFVRVVKVIDFPNIHNLYVEVVLGNAKATTFFLETSNSSLNQVFAFDNGKNSSSNVDVFLKDRTSGMFIGHVKFAVGDIPKRVPPESSLAPQRYTLEDQAGTNLARGAIMLSMWFGTQADEYFPQAWCSDTTEITDDSVCYTRSKVYMSPSLRYVKVTVIQAHHLLLQFPPESSELFVQVGLGKSFCLRTSFSKEKSAKPFWNEDLMFVTQEPFDEELVLSVEQVRLADHVNVSLGTYTTNLNNSNDVDIRFDDVPADDRWVDLNRPGIIENAREVKFASKIHLRISLNGGYHVSDEPLEYSSDFRPSSRDHWPPSIGVLELGILKATNLMPMKIGGRTDAYCVAKYGPKWVRTRTSVDSREPRWNEQYVWEVYEPFTVITIGVFDNNQLDPESRARGARDTIMAKIRIRLSTLENGKVYAHSYPLIGLHPSGVTKMGEIHLAVKFTWTSQSTFTFPFESIFNKCALYGRPLFPAVHYFLPLSPTQFDTLRNQAFRIISVSLSEAEPALREEVVSYMLDMRSDMWSMRKGIANYNRIMSLISYFFAFWKWLEDIRQWKNPIEAVLFHIFCLCVLLYPEPMIPLVSFYLFKIGLDNYNFKKHEHPCHIDATLSGADTTNYDDLEEELVFFPTQIGGEHLRRRYDRLRVIGRNGQKRVDELATILEKLQSLISWRDPRATFIFLVFCVVCLPVTYFVPLKVIIFPCIFIYLRHPRFRSNTPWHAENIFRRLPSKQAFIL